MMIPVDMLLAYGATYKTVNAGEIIFSEGSRCIFYYQLVTGSVKWVNINEEGKEFLQNIIQPGECFGELPLFDGAPYAASAIAIEDSVVLRLHHTTFHQLLKELPELHFSFSRLLAERVRFKFFMLKEIACHEPEKRIASLIQYFKNTQHNICPKCCLLRLTRQQVADMTGLRVETVIRTMRHMHERGEITIEKGKVYCTNMSEVITLKCMA